MGRDAAAPATSAVLQEEAPDAREDVPSALRRVLLNVFALLGAYVLPRACTLAAAVVAARVLGVEAFGIYGTAAALAVLLSIVTTLGMMQLLVRELARTPDRAVELMGAANVVKAGSAVLMMGVLGVLLAGPLDYTPAVAACAILLGLSYVVVSWLENLGAWFQAAERMEVWMQAQALFGVVAGSLAIGLALGTRSVVWFAAAPLVGHVAAVGWLAWKAPPAVRTAWGASWPTVAMLLRSLAPFAFYVIALTAYAKMDLLLVERWRGLAEAGIYSAAYKFVDLAQALALVVATALYPRLSRAGAANGRDPAASRTAELLLLAGVPAATVLWLIRGPLVGWVFGADYAASAPVLGLLAPALPLLALNTLGGFVLAARGRMSAVARLYGAALVLDVGLNVLLVPPLGAAGAAAARLASEVVVAGLMLVLLRRVSGLSLSPRVVVAVALSVCVAALLRPVALPAPGALASYLGATLAVYALVRVVPLHEWALLRRAVAR